MGKFLFFLGLGAGYVLGAKAGRKRYEQIARAARKFKDNPKVQGVAGVLEAQAESAISTIKGKIGNETSTGTESAAYLNGSGR